ncbi:hypothetical protein V6N13_127191 [Hibiscus sabdariffa]
MDLAAGHRISAEADCTDNNLGFEEQCIRVTNTDQSRGATSPEKTMYASMVKKGSNGIGCEPFDDDLSPDKEECGVEKRLGEIGDHTIEVQIVCGQQETGFKELYRPWMIASNRRRRPTMGSSSERVVAETPGVASGSRFVVLQEESPFNFMEAGTEVANPIHVSPSAKDVATAGTSKGAKKVIYHESTTERHSKPVGASVCSDDEVAVVSLVPRSEMIVDPHKFTSSTGTHRVVSIRERSDLGKGGSHLKLSNAHDSRGKGLKDGLPKGLRIQKGFDFQPTRRTPLADWVQSTSDRIQADIDATRSSSDPENAMEEDGRESDSLHAFRPSQSRTGPGVFDGNRGAASPGFKCHLRDFVCRTNPVIVILLETRVSGVGVDSVVRKLGFVNSFRIEAQWFNGRIWILWTDLVVVEVKLVSTQFVHYCFRPVNSHTWS